MKTFLMQGASNNWTVAVDNPDQGRLYPLPEYFGLCKCSPDGFAWGYSGSAPSQLAFALLYNITLDEQETRALFHQFRDEVIAKMDRNVNHTLHEKDIRFWLEKKRRSQQA